MNGNELRELFRQIVMKAFQIDHGAYLQDAGKSFVGLKIDTLEKRFVPLFGSPSDTLLEAPFAESCAGYSVGAADKPQGLHTDVLLMASQFLSDDADTELRGALLLHEACHLIIDAKLKRLHSTGSDDVRATGFLTRLSPDDHFHDKEFLLQLAAAARVTAGDTAADALMNLAMKFDALPADCDDPE